MNSISFSWGQVARQVVSNAYNTVLSAPSSAYNAVSNNRFTNAISSGASSAYNSVSRLWTPQALEVRQFRDLNSGDVEEAPASSNRSGRSMKKIAMGLAGLAALALGTYKLLSSDSSEKAAPQREEAKPVAKEEPKAKEEQKVEEKSASNALIQKGRSRRNFQFQ